MEKTSAELLCPKSKRELLLKGHEIFLRIVSVEVIVFAMSRPCSGARPFASPYSPPWHFASTGGAVLQKE
jgi:hypothetical protein